MNASCLQPSFDGFQGFTRLFLSRFTDPSVINVLPQPAMLFEVNDDCLFSAPLIGHKIESVHMAKDNVIWSKNKTTH
jgi:hypothetical protein